MSYISQKRLTLRAIEQIDTSKGLKLTSLVLPISLFINKILTEDLFSTII